MNIEANNNTYIILGITGVGKSNLARVLSENNTIEIGKSLSSCTAKPNYYICNYENFNYVILDTPGFIDTSGTQKDSQNYEYIREALTDNNHKIKGILILFNFQENKFLPYHEKALKKIIGLMPIPNFWSYVTIIFTHYYFDGFEEIEELKKGKIQYYKPCLEKIMYEANFKKGIKIIDFNQINIHFINIKWDKSKKKIYLT